VINMAIHQDIIGIMVNSEKTHHQDFERILFCPQTRKKVKNNDFQILAVPGGQAIWWHCPACRGWHVIMET